MKQNYWKVIEEYVKTGREFDKLSEPLVKEFNKYGLNNKQDVINELKDKYILDGKLDMNYESANRIYNKWVNTNLNEEQEKIIEKLSAYPDLVASYLFGVNKKIREKVGDVEKLYKVVLNVTSKKHHHIQINRKSGTGQINDLLPYDLEELIKDIPKKVFNGEEEYQRRLRVLLRKKAERDSFHIFKENEQEAFKFLEKRIKTEDNDNLREIYVELNETYKNYSEFKAENVNEKFEDPIKKQKGVLPSLHQKIALYNLIKNKKFGVFDGCGTGKTAIAVLAQPLIEKELNQNNKEFKRAVIICPNSAKSEWEKGLIGEDNIRYLKDKQDIIVINGEEKKDEKFFKDLSNKKWIILNYEQLTTRTENGSLFYQELSDLGIDYLIFDEAHHIKSQKTKTSKGKPTYSTASRVLAHKSNYLTLLTGSPIPDSLDDYAVLYHLLDPKECPDPKEFKNKYEKNPRVLYTFFNEKSIRRTAEDINDFLEWEEFEESIKLNQTQKKIYDEIMNFRAQDWQVQARKSLLDPRLTDPRTLKRLDLLGKVNYDDSSKYKKLEEILTNDDGPIANGEKFIIFSSTFREGVTQDEHEGLRKDYIKLGVEEEFNDLSDLEKDVLVKLIDKNINNKNGNKLDKNIINLLNEKGYILEDGNVNLSLDNQVYKYLDLYNNLGLNVSLPKKIEKILEEKYGKKFKIGVIDGTVEENERKNIINGLKEDLSGIICTTDTGGESLNFTDASYAIFLDENFSPKTNDQALARLVRMGQDKKVKIYYLRTENTLEEALKDYVEKKRLLSKMAIDGHKLTNEEIDLLYDTQGMKFGELIKRNIGGESINVKEAEINNYDNFATIIRKRFSKESKVNVNPEYEMSNAQKIMRWIGQDPVNCWNNPEFVKLYVETLNNLSVPIVHKARISDLIKRNIKKQIEFPEKILAEGSGPSILYDTYQELNYLLGRYNINMPIIVDRDLSQEMLSRGKNPNKILGNMTGENSIFKENEFDMIDNGSISLLKNRNEVKSSLLEASRILKPKGLIELVLQGKKFVDSFYSGMENLGFEILSKKNEGFSVSPKFQRELREKYGLDYSEAYANKLINTYFMLARKIDNPGNVNSEDFWFEHIDYEERENNKKNSSKKNEIIGRVAGHRGKLLNVHEDGSRTVSRKIK